MSFGFRVLLPLLLAGAALLPAVAAEAQDDPGNPHYKQAQQDLDKGDATRATEEYEAALATNPQLAAAHYEVGVIYAEKLSQPIAAIYHLQRYLKLAPTADHAAAARDIITTESEAFAASLPGTSVSTTVAKLQLENGALKKQRDDAARTIAQLQAQLAQAEARPAAAPEPTTGAPSPLASNPAVSTGPAGTMPPPATNSVATAPVTTGARSYTVMRGDVVWTIAKKMYPHHVNEGVEKIQDANKDVLKGRFLQPGQVLVIPE